MEGEDTRLWQEIVNFQFIFDRPEKCIDLLNDINKEDFTAQFETLFFSETAKRLDIQLVTDKHAKDQKKFYNENNKKDKMYKDVLKRQKYEGTYEWFKAYSKYDDDNIKT